LTVGADWAHQQSILGLLGVEVAGNMGGFLPAPQAAFGVDALGGRKGERGQERGVVGETPNLGSTPPGSIRSAAIPAGA
jgi:hypothetical protein